MVYRLLSRPTCQVGYFGSIQIAICYYKADTLGCSFVDEGCYPTYDANDDGGVLQGQVGNANNEALQEQVDNADSDDAIIFPSGPAEVHHVIFSQSLEVMAKMLRKDIYSLRHPGLSIDQAKKPDPDPLAAMRYSCVYWVDHLLGGSNCSEYESNFRGSGIVHRLCKSPLLARGSKPPKKC
jgi:hypothetical protein